MSIKFITNEAQVMRNLGMINSQVAFALARTLTTAAFDGRAAVQANLPKWLDIRKPFLAKSVVANRATKNSLMSEVKMLDRAKLAPILEEGGTRKPRGRTIAMPVGVDHKRLTKSKRPQALLARKDTFSAEINGVAGIWQKLKNGRLKLMYAYEPSATYEPRKIHFRKTVLSVASKSISKNLGKNIADAVRTAK
jgi:hypothetical protein